MTKVPERLALETEIPFEDPDVRKAYLGFLKLARGGKESLDCKDWNGSEDCEKKPVKKYCEIVALNRIENMGCATYFGHMFTKNA